MNKNLAVLEPNRKNFVVNFLKRVNQIINPSAAFL
jgi:hypothetical protein